MVLESSYAAGYTGIPFANMNYQTELEKMIDRISMEKAVPKLLLHSCCGPCSSYVLSYLMEYFDITVYFYNPNIYPETEFELRKKEQLRLIEELNSSRRLFYELNGQAVVKNRLLPIQVTVPAYNHDEFTECAKGFEKEPEGGLRCKECFRLRLEHSFRYAQTQGFDYFGTTLTVSPHKNALLLNEIGKGLEDGCTWLLSDFKKREGYKTSILLSKQYSLYRQDYCGCEFSLHGKNS